jgi:PEP-CTERM motif
MTVRFLGRLGHALALTASLSAGVAFAEPVVVTSGLFEITGDNPPFFRFFGDDGFELSGIFATVASSPFLTCLAGCAPGSELNMNTVAGGTSGSGSLGFATGAIIDGTVFYPPFALSPESPVLTGTLRFESPTVIVPPQQDDALFLLNITVPFTLTGDVTGFAHDDLDATTALFRFGLVGHGSARLSMVKFDGALDEGKLEYTFAAAADPVPEPATIFLLGTGLAGAGLRRYRR